MNMILKLSLLFCFIPLISSCMNIDTPEESIILRTSLEIATLRYIEETDTTYQDVIDGIREFRATVNLDGTITAAEIMNTARVVFDIANRPPSEQAMILGIMRIAEQRLNTYSGDLEQVSATADEVLTWIEEIVGLYASGDAPTVE